MEHSAAAAEALEAIGASALALAAELRRVADPGPAGTDPVPGQADPLQGQADAFLDGLTNVAGMQARLASVKVHCAAGIAAAEEAMAPPDERPSARAAREMSVTASVACALTVSDGAAARFLTESARLSTDLPLTLTGIGSGTLSWQHGRIMCDETDGLSPEAAGALEAHFLDPDAPNPARGCPAGELTPARFRARARYWRERHHQDSIETRHRNSAKDRRLEYTPDRDSMAWISAYLPADQAAGIWNRATAAARGLQGPTETRTLTQLRADVASAWMLTPGKGAGGTHPGPVLAGSVSAGSVSAGDAPGGSVSAGHVPSPAAQVLVTVPVFSLLGHTDEPAVLDGYGPIPASMARRLVANGATSFLRVLTDPRDGAPLEIGRTSYRVTKPMRQWLRLRDAKCTFPGCNNHSLDNDADHILAWADGGGTGVANLGQPCPKHHRLKHTTAWKPVGATRDTPPGWISPAGRHYPAEQQDWEPPIWPESQLGQNCPELPPEQDLPELPGQDCPEPPDWFDVPPDQDRSETPTGQNLPEPSGWPDLLPDQDFPEPPDWPEPPDQPDDPDDLIGFDGHSDVARCQGPGSSEDPEALDGEEHQVARDHLAPRLPVDSGPYRSSFTAA
ncbi:DUF222 domain-containing protein [Arthrobacter sp. NPDC056727]|uniref:HNH endonuclease signature motif containing protein n=1 Tax=Arthrobacter sp. NPDC056727 TaxID=3345927 RepID=UPI00366D67CD